MGQYQADFSAESLGVKTDIAGWTRRWDYGFSGANASMEIVADAEGQGGKALRFTSNQNVRNLLSLDALDGSGELECAILCRYTRQSGFSGPSIVLRGSGTDQTETGAIGQILDDAGSAKLRIYRYLGGGGGNFSLDDFLGVTNGLYWLKFKANSGTVFTVDLYDATDLSLVANHTFDPSEIAGAGWAGLFAFSAGAVYDVLDFLAATAGDTVTLYVPGGGDATAPVLSSPTGSATGATTADGGVATDEGNGTLYAVCTTSATPPSIAQVKAGQDHTGAAAAYDTSQAVSVTGAQAVAATGLTASTAYYWHFLQADAAGNDSNIVTSAQFTTDAAAPAEVEGVSITLYQSDGTTPAANLTNIVALWWAAAAPSGAPDIESATESTDGSGVFTLDLSAGALSVGQTGFLLLYDLDSVDHRDSLVFAGQEAVVDIS